MNVVWRRSETREVRPFSVAERLSRSVSQVSLSLFEGAPFSEDSSIQIDEENLSAVCPALRFGWSAEALEALVEHAGSASRLIVLLRSGLLKKSMVVRNWPLEETPDDVVALPRERVLGFGPSRDLEIEVAIALGTDQESGPSTPFRKGQWLAKKVFSIRTASPDRVFDIRPLDDQEWESRRFPKKTLWSLEYLGGLCEPMGSADVIATLYLHRKLFDRLATPAFAPGKAIMGILGAEATAQLLMAARDDWFHLAEAPAGSPLESVLTRLATNGRLDLEQLKDLVAPDGSGRLRALVQDRCEILETVTKG